MATKDKNRSQRAILAQETLEILERGSYTAPSGKRVDVLAALEFARQNTVLYKPEQFDAVVVERDSAAKLGEPPRIEVTGETTLEAAHRLIVEGQLEHVLALNFASAKNPGGGFLGGSRAQEESIARSSGLYLCLSTQHEGYYEHHRRMATAFYSDRMIYSPDVPIFRDDPGNLLESPYPLTVLTSPAVNAGAVHKNEPKRSSEIVPVMRERAAKVLSAAAAHGHRTLVLGAWGCGVFRQDPRQVAALFAEHLTGNTFSRLFKRIVFAVFDPSPDQATFRTFRNALATDVPQPM